LISSQHVCGAVVADEDVRIGWGNALYGGVAKVGAGAFDAVIYLISHENANGEEGAVIPILLPAKAMERFEHELHDILLEVSFKPNVRYRLEKNV